VPNLTVFERVISALEQLAGTGSLAGTPHHSRPEAWRSPPYECRWPQAYFRSSESTLGSEAQAGCKTRHESYQWSPYRKRSFQKKDG